MVQRNDYYSSTINEFYGGKDSIIELAKVITYDNNKQVAKVYTMTSNQYKDDVPVYFPALYQNTGIISPPVQGSTSMLLWGADRQPFLLPVQITTPAVEVDKGLTNVNASPAVVDVLHTLKNIQGGEHLLRSLGGAYIFLKNLGDVEMGTSRLHRLTVTEKDGALDLLVERIRSDTGNSRFYLGPVSMDSNEDLRTHYYFDLEEYADEPSKIKNVENDDIINHVLADTLDDIEIEDNEKIYKSQKGHVFSESGELQYDSVDGTELFSEDIFEKEGVKRVEQLSKGGRKVIRTSTSDSQTEVTVSASEVFINRNSVTNQGTKSTTIRIDENGQLLCGQDGKEYDLIPMLKWFYEQRQ
ncbi:hypothetical protein [Priestia megaterium]|uniref:hypothetical protein n=1 Tax=Priestia megaterium TaxID=1404 RepID=UPI000BFC388C|nr:hypothetical protein [Priestia megaterium]PGQ88291.1 hypothetical protein COA18_05010 [Priestia megaterium]